MKNLEKRKFNNKALISVLALLVLCLSFLSMTMLQKTANAKEETTQKAVLNSVATANANVLGIPDFKGSFHLDGEVLNIDISNYNDSIKFDNFSFSAVDLDSKEILGVKMFMSCKERNIIFNIIEDSYTQYDNASKAPIQPIVDAFNNEKLALLFAPNPFGQSRFCINLFNSSSTELIDLPIPPTKVGYDFVAWCTDEALTEELAPNTKITADTQLYAKFKKHAYTINFYVDNEVVNTQKVLYQDKVTMYNYESVSHNLLGWFTDSNFKNEFDSKTKVESNLNIYAKTELKTFEVTFYIDNEVYTVLTVPYGTVLNKQKELAKAMALCSNVNCDYSLDKAVVDDTIENVTITATLKPELTGWNAFGNWWIVKSAGLANGYWVLIGFISALIIGITCKILYKRA